MRRVFFIVVVLCCVPFSARPSSTEGLLTLREALQRAGAGNKTLDSARKSLGIFEGQVLTAKAIPNPEFDFNLSQVSTDNPSLSDSAKDFSLQQTIETGGKRKLRTKAAKAQLSAEEARYDALKLDIEQQVKQAYWDLSLARERLNFGLQNLQFQQRFLSRVQEKFQISKANLADLTRAKVEVAKAFNELFESEKDLENAKATLNKLMGQSVRANLPWPEHLTEMTIPLNEDHLVDLALSNRPERETLERLQEGGDAELRLAKTMLWAPDLKVMALYQKGERGDGNDSFGGGIGLNIPLFNHFKGERVSAEAKIEALKSQEEDLNQQIALDVHQAIQEIKLTDQQIKLWKETVDQATESARLAEQRYLEGDVDLAIFIQARRELVDTTVQYFQSLKNYRVNIAALERAVGTNLIKGGRS